MASEPNTPECSRRQALKVAVSALCCENGFTHADESALETLTEMLQSLITEIGRSTRALAELSCRTEPMLGDAVLAMVEAGVNVQALPAYAKRSNKMMFIPPQPSAPSLTPRTLQTGQKQSHPSYIPDYLPQFPDPHTYIKTPTHKPPSSEYQLIREKAASQKRDVERALTRFIAKTGETESLFQDDPYAFPLIATAPKPLPYMDALLPKDQDLDAQEELTSEEPIKKSPRKTERDFKPQTPPSAALQEAGGGITKPQTPTGGEGSAEGDSQIDNPYLRPIKMPRLKGKGKSKW